MTALHHELSGPADAPVVVLSHALGATSAIWDAQEPALAERFRVLRYDLRGHGRSPVPDAPTTLAELGGDVTELLDGLGVERASLVGVSLGGMISLWLAAFRPERVERLVVACTSAQLGTPESWRERADLVRAEGTGAVADAVVGRWFTAAFAAAEPARVRAYRDGIAATPAAGYAGLCHAIETMDLRADLGRVEAPTLVVAGAEDPSTPPDHGRAIADRIRGASLLVLGRAAHLANVEQPDAFNRALLAHLQEEP
jgi:3-oxoadipate enol-lactonase